MRINAPDQIESRLSPNYMIIDGKYVTYAYLPSSAYPVQAYGGWLQVLFGYMEDVNVDLWVHKESPESIQRRLQFELKNKRIQQKNTDDIASDYDDIVSSLEAGFFSFMRASPFALSGTQFPESHCAGCCDVQ